MSGSTAQVAIIGAGLSGLGAAIALRDAGIDDVAILEKADRVGGTWRENTYPGCACDVPSSLYSFSFAPNPDWSRIYGQGSEIQQYIERVATERNLLETVRFNTEVEEAAWDAASASWTINTSADALQARVLIAAAGPLHEPSIPDLPGLAEFPGAVFHSSRWDHDHDLTGRRVAVVGTGASAIQFVPEIQPRVSRLHVFQRTAPWVLPKLDREISSLEKAAFRHAPDLQRTWRSILYHAFEAVQIAQRHPRLMGALHRVGLRNLRRAVADPDLRASLTPQFTLGCKRILLSNTWYPAITSSNAQLIPHAVQEIRGRTIIAADGTEVDVDTIIFGTGFHVTDPPIANRVRGPDGRTLAERWEAGMAAYLGTAVAGFPNFFTMIGPNLGNGHTSAIVIIEAQARYITGAVRKLLAGRTIDVRQDHQDRWNQSVQRALRGTVWNAGGCSSYYLDSGGRNATIYPWTTLDLRRRLRTFDATPYEIAS